MTKRILAARCNVQHMTSLDAKMTYIKAWQRLADSGTAYFVVTFKGSKKKVTVLRYRVIAESKNTEIKRIHSYRYADPRRGLALDIPTLMLIAQTVFLLEHGHTKTTESHKRN